MKNKKIRNLVLGSGGFVGKDFCKFLRDKGEEVIEFDIKNGKHQDCRKVKLHLKNIDFVYFLAWDVGGSKYLYKKSSQEKQMSWNLSLMQNIFPQLQKWNKPFLFISSQLASDTSSIYGVQKRLGELWTNLLPLGRIVRLWNIYGSIEPISERSHVIADFIHQAIETGEIHMQTDGCERRKFVYKSDVHDVFYEVITKENKSIVDVTSNEWISLFEVAKIIAKYTNSKVISGNKKGREQMTPILGKLPNWNPKISLYEGLKKTINEFKENKK